MIIKIFRQGFLATLLGLALFATAQAQAGSSATAVILHLEGTVTVNGTNAISGATVFSDSTIVTRQNSSAVVSLGKLGRVEVLPDTTMKLSYGESDITVAMLDAGRVRISSSPNTTAKATTRDGEINTIAHQRNTFTVDTSCGNTFVAVKSGKVELRAGSTVKQIAAGGQDTAGTATPGCTPQP
jgi:hypothetical protein